MYQVQTKHVQTFKHIETVMFLDSAIESGMLIRGERLIGKTLTRRHVTCITIILVTTHINVYHNAIIEARFLRRWILKYVVVQFPTCATYEHLRYCNNFVTRSENCQNCTILCNCLAVLSFLSTCQKIT